MNQDHQSQAPHSGRWLYLLALGAWCALLFSRATGFEFLNADDIQHVSGNPLLQHPFGLENIWKIWRAPYLDLYIPVSYSAWGLLKLFSDSPAVFHTANILLHWINGILVFLLIERLARDWTVESSSSPSNLSLAAFTGSMIFLSHPLQVEPVAWISGFRDVLAATLALCAIQASLHVLDIMHVNPRARASIGVQVAVNAICMLSILSKPQAVAVPVAISALQGLRGRKWLPALKLLAPTLILCCFITAITAQLQAPEPDEFTLTLWERPFAALQTLGFIALKIAFPYPIGSPYVWRPAIAPSTFAFWLQTGAVLAALAILWFRRKRWPVTLAAVGFSLACLLPSLGLFNFRFQALSVFADRYAYLALVGVSIGAAYWFHMATCKTMAKLLTIVLVLTLGAISFARLPTWRDDHSFFTDALKKIPQDAVTQTVYGATLASEGRLDEAYAHLKEAYRQQPDGGITRDNLVAILSKLGRLQELTLLYRDWIGRNPEARELHFVYGHLLLLQGQVREGVLELGPLTALNDPAANHCKVAEKIANTLPDRKLIRASLLRASKQLPKSQSIANLLQTVL